MPLMSIVRMVMRIVTEDEKEDEWMQQPQKILRSRSSSLTGDKKTINLNVNLLKASCDVIDYIILHELCYLKTNHPLCQ